MRKINSVFIILYLLVSLSSCHKKTKEQSDVIPPDSVVYVEEEVFQLITNWREAQNGGDFEAYSSVYSESFIGIKRAGDNVRHYYKKDWLKDRGRMFRKPMTVKTNNLKIFHKESPCRVLFEQSWASGSFSDYGRKELFIEKEGDSLKIVSEEMLESIITNVTSNANHAFSNPRLFKRLGDFVPIDVEFEVQHLLRVDHYKADDYSSYTPTIDIHYYSMSVLDSIRSLDSLIGNKIILGSVNSTEVTVFEVKQWVAKNVVLQDSLPGIARPSSIFEESYEWIGGDELRTDYETGLLCSQDEQQPYEEGQWALISDIVPVIYSQRELLNDERLSYQNRMIGNPDNELILFSGNNQLFLVSYNHDSECGDDIFTEIKLWGAAGDQFKLISSLPDFPTMIMDIENDGELDVIYNGDFEKRMNPFFWWWSPNYRKQGEDTVFLSCGC